MQIKMQRKFIRNSNYNEFICHIYHVNWKLVKLLHVRFMQMSVDDELEYPHGTEHCNYLMRNSYQLKISLD